MSEIVLGIRLTADGKDLVGSVRVSREEMDKLSASMRASGAEAAKAKGEMLSWAQFLKARMGPAMAEFKGSADAHTLAIRKLAAEWKVYKANAGEATSVAQKLNEEQKNLGRTLNVTANSIGAYSAAWNIASSAILRAAGAVRDYIKDAALLNARYETLGVVLGVVGRNAGYTRGEMDLYTELVRKSGITMIESRESIVKMVQANLDLAIAHKLARVAQDAASIANINSSEAFARMIHGIQSGQTEILRTMGINVNFEDSYKKLAKQLNVTTEQLTEQEKTQARANVTLEATTQIAGTYEAAMSTAGKQINSLARYQQDLKTVMGETFNEALVIAVNTYTDALKGAGDEAQRLANDQKLKEWGRDLVGVFALLVDQLQAFKIVAVEIATPVERLGRNIFTLGALSSIALGPGSLAEKKAAIDQLRQESQAYYKALDDRLKANRDFRSAAAEANEFFNKQDTEAAQKALEGRYDEMDFGSRYAPKTGAARPTGKTEGADMRDFVRQLKEQVEITKQSTLEEKVLFELREKHWKNATPQLKAQAVEYARQLDLRKQEEQILAANLKYYEYQAGERERQNDAVYQFNKSNTDTLQQIELETQLIGKTREQQELLTGLSRLESEYRKTSVDLTGRAADSARQLYEQQRRDLEDAILKKNTAQRAQDVIDKNKEAAKRLEDDLQRGLTDSIFRGFEAGKGFAENFRDSLVNMFKTTILRPVIQWVVSPLTGAATAALGGLGIPGLANAAGGAGSLSGLGGLGNLFGGSQTLADFGNFFGSIGSITEAGSTFGVLDAIGGFAAANPWTAAAMVALPLLGGLFGGGKVSAASLGDMGRSYGPGGDALSTWQGPFGTGAGGETLDALQARYAQAARGLGITPGASSFYYGANTGAGGANPMFRLAGGATGGAWYDSGTETARTDANVANAAARAVLTALQGSELPGYLRKYFDSMVADSLDAAGIDAAIQFGAALKGIREQLTMTGAEIAETRIEELNAALGANARSVEAWKTQFLAAIDAGTSPQAVAQWQQLGQAIDTAAQASDAAAQASDAAAQAARAAVDAETRLAQERLTAVRAAEDQLQRAYRDQASALEATAKKWSEAARALRQYRDGLLLGDLSPLSPEARYAEAARQFGDVSSRARLGDEAAIGQLQAVSEAFLQASRGYNASGGDYMRDFERVRDTLAATASVADRQSSIAQSQLDVLQEQLRGIVDINTTALSIAQLLAGLGNAVAGMVRPYGQDLVNPAAARAEQWNALTSGGAAWASRAGAVAIRQPGEAEALIRAIDGSSFTTADARSWVMERAANDPLSVYQTAREKGISLASLDTMMQGVPGWEGDLAQRWAREQGLPSFDAGGRAQPGLALVGESGPELVRFGAPAQVFTAPQTRAMLAGDDGTGRETVAELRALIRLQSAANKALLDKLASVEKRLGGIEANARIEAAA